MSGIRIDVSLDNFDFREGNVNSTHVESILCEITCHVESILHE